MTTPQQFYTELEAILELDPGAIKGDELLEAIHWDSMAVVMYIAAADAKFGVSVNAADVRNATTVQDLYQILVK